MGWELLVVHPAQMHEQLCLSQMMQCPFTLVDEAKGAVVGHDDIWYLPFILPSPSLQPREAICQDIKGVLSC